jgi:hypothetical protein
MQLRVADHSKAYKHTYCYCATVTRCITAKGDFNLYKALDDYHKAADVNYSSDAALATVLHSSMYRSVMSSVLSFTNSTASFYIPDCSECTLRVGKDGKYCVEANHARACFGCRHSEHGCEQF